MEILDVHRKTQRSGQFLRWDQSQAGEVRPRPGSGLAARPGRSLNGIDSDSVAQFTGITQPWEAALEETQSRSFGDTWVWINTY